MSQFCETVFLGNTENDCFFLALYTEAVNRWCSVITTFVKISQNSQENTSAGFSL